MELTDAPKYAYPSDLLSAAAKAIEALKELPAIDHDLDELYEVQVEIGSPIVASFSGQWFTYRYAWSGETWRPVS